MGAKIIGIIILAAFILGAMIETIIVLVMDCLPSLWVGRGLIASELLMLPAIIIFFVAIFSGKKR